MEGSWVFLVSTLSFIILLLWKLGLSKKNPNGPTPPSPPALPIIGHLHLLKNPLHRTMTDLAAKYGPIMSLSFGSRPVLVVSSPSAVQQCLTENDIVFANRPQFLSGKYLNYNYSTIGTANYGPHWRNLRRISSLEIFSPRRIAMFRDIRQEEVKDMLKSLFRVSGGGEFAKVEMRPRVTAPLFNVIMRMLTGKRYYGDYAENSEQADGVKEVLHDGIRISEVSHPGDYVPVLKWFGYGKLVKRLEGLEKKLNRVFDGLLKDLRSKRVKGNGGKTKTTVDVLFELQDNEPEIYTNETIKGLVMNLIGAATDTSAVILEWGMASLLNDPSILKKARAEVDSIIGHDRLVNEDDIPSLPYIQAIINETLRLYPSLPLMVPHESSEDCTVEGYRVKKGTMLFLNIWAIQRDPKLWDDATTFKPERFEGSEGESSKFLPFGIGRRGCPGNVLAPKILGLGLASLIQCFDWERVGKEKVDMTEGTGITMPMAKPLEAMCRVRKCMIPLLSQL